MSDIKNELRKSLGYFIRKMPWSYQDRISYFLRLHKIPHIKHPKLFNEKVLYRKHIYGDYKCYARLADKYLVREYVANKIGEQYLVPLVYETKDPSTLLTMPKWKDTVIKPNHASLMVEILLDEPDDLRKQKIINNCYEWLKVDYSIESREIHYRYIEPRILVEQFIGEHKSAPVDYKFHMFNKRDGSFEYVLQIVYNRESPTLSCNYYVNNLVDAHCKGNDTGTDFSDKVPMLEKTLELSKKLATDFDYVRIDWYINDDQIYFGELTFTPCSGMATGLDNGLDEMMGEMWIQDRAEMARKKA